MFNRSHVKDVFDQLDALDQQDELEQHEDGADTTADGNAQVQVDAASSAPEVGGGVASTNDDDIGPESVTPPRAKGVLRRVGLATVGVVTVAVLGLSAYLGWQFKQLNDAAAASRAALAVARTYAVTLTSVDSKDVDKNFDQVLDGATGEFKSMYSQSAAQLRQLLIDNKAQAKGTVVDAAVESVTKTKVKVLLFIDQSVTNSINPTPRIDRSRVAMTMELIDNRWLASKVDVT